MHTNDNNKLLPGAHPSMTCMDQYLQFICEDNGNKGLILYEGPVQYRVTLFTYMCVFLEVQRVPHLLTLKR